MTTDTFPRLSAFLSPLALIPLALAACSPHATPPATASPLRKPAPITLTYLGVAGWQVTDGDDALLVNPYFTRAPVEDDDALLVPNEALISQHAPPRPRAVLVEHAHYDHLLDAPSIAKKTGAKLVGSESALNVARASGVAESSLVLARGGESFALGPFAVRAFRGLHSLNGSSFGTIPRSITVPMSAKGYAMGETVHYLVRAEGRAILFISSANFIESELEGQRPDVAVVAVGAREKIPDYTCRLMRALGRPRLVLANHFDALWEPLGPKQTDIDEDARASLANFEREVHACAPETSVVVPKHFQPIAL